jgi:hypothetical protein
MRWSDERPAVTAAFGETPPVDLVLDSAASGLVLFNAPFNATSGERDRKSTRLKSLSAEIDAPVVTGDVLRIGGMAFAHPTAALVTIEGDARGGLLPTAMFERIYFDNQRSRVVVVRRP